MKRSLKTAVFGLNKLCRKIVRASGTPHQIALGIAIGFFFGVLPVPGQYLFAVVACTLCRANRVVAFLPVWLSNPATVVPLYTFNYWIGWLLAGGPGVGRIREALNTCLPEMNDASVDFVAHPYLWSKEWLHDTWANIAENHEMMASLGWDALVPLYVGSCVVGLALGAVSYYGTLCVMRTVSARIADKRRQRHERVTIRLAEVDRLAEVERQA